MARAWFGLMVVLCSNALPHDAGAQDRWVQADDQISRLAPSAFAKVPSAVIQALVAMKCTIPQASGDPAPHNVVRGSFAKPGQTDYAALCSRAKASAIVIIWGGPSVCSDELEVREDRSYLQRVAGDKIVFTRRLAVLSPDGIQRLYERYGGVTPPLSNRQGIEDITEGNGSVVRLCHEGRWIELTGRQN